MDIQNFISQTLIQIFAGVKDAQGAISQIGSGAMINPVPNQQHSPRSTARPQGVEFDIAVTVSESAVEGSTEKLGGKAGLLSVVSLQAAAEVAGDRRGAHGSETVSRVKFTVEVALPAHVYQLPGASPLPPIPSSARI